MELMGYFESFRSICRLVGSAAAMSAKHRVGTSGQGRPCGKAYQVQGQWVVLWPGMTLPFWVTSTLIMGSLPLVRTVANHLNGHHLLSAFCERGHYKHYYLTSNKPTRRELSSLPALSLPADFREVTRVVSQQWEAEVGLESTCGHCQSQSSFQGIICLYA